MSLLLDDQKIAAVAKILELALEVGHDVYATVLDAMKTNHPELVPADLPSSEEKNLEKATADMIAKKFGPGEPA